MKVLMKHNYLSKKIVSNQEGFAAFAVTMLIMIILSLIVLGFAANARRNEVNALNKQLSTGAYYAAESGINQAYAKIRQDYPNITSNNNCKSSSYGSQTLSSTASISCLLVNTAPTTLQYRPIDIGQSVVTPIQASSTSGSSNPIHDLTISWQNHSITSGSFSSCPSTSQFQQTNNYNCPAGVLQIDIFKDPSTSGSSTNLTPSNLLSDTKVIYLQPSTVSSRPVSNISNGQVIPGSCTSNPTSSNFDCTVQIKLSGLFTGATASGVKYFMRILPFYDNTDVQISAQGSGGFTPISLRNSQAVIDSTGSVSGVYKRLQARVCISSYCSSAVPAGAIQSTTGICKQFTTYPGFTSGTGASSSPLC